MLRSGLCSVTFRQLSVLEIVELVAKAGLDAIEWGGDIHAPHGDLKIAREVKAITAGAGLAIPSYGSYYRVGPADPVPFEKVLETSVELGAPVIRVWAGKVGSGKASAADRAAVEKDSIRIAGLAAKAGVTVAFEYHGNTLTDTLESTLALLKAVRPARVKAYWQPRSGLSREQNLAELKAVLADLSHVHCFSWQGATRLPLAGGSADWAEYLKLASAPAGDRTVYLEFVKNDAPEQFLADAETVRKWLEAY